MKSYHFSVILLGFLILGIQGELAAQKKVDLSQMRDAASHDELSQKLRMAKQSDPIRNLGPPTGNTEEDPSLANAERDLVKSSAIFSFRGNLTLVPKRAVLHVPSNYESRMAPVKGDKVQTWRQFYQSNRGWIRTMEVTREQALGHVPFSEETAEAISESSVVVVATYKGGPISVLPLKDEEAVPAASDMKPVTFQ
ncbi:MAG: hypothetical protein AAF733_00415 [Verrucomicrobiota bacterium]